MYTQIGDSIFLGRVELPRNEGRTQFASPTNHIWIEDISGSTVGFIRKLGQDLMDKVNNLPNGDFLTYCVFSSKGEYRVVLKGVEVTVNSRAGIRETIDRNSHATNMTCFSEVLSEVAKIVPDLVAFSKRFSLMFFTDGYPVPDSVGERKAIEKAIRKINGLLSKVMLVGYGDYYNRELLGQMALWFGGSLIHSEEMQYFSVSMDKFVKESVNAVDRVSVKLPPGAFDPFTIDEAGITVYEMDGRTAHISPESGHVYWLDSSDEGNALVEPDAMIDGIYGAALVLSQKMKADVAVQVLGRLGDKRLVGLLGNAMTQSEFGNAETAIKEAATYPKLRFIDGRAPNCLPDPNAPCAIDLLNSLIAEGALFFPYDREFHYKPIGRGTIYPDGTPEFVPDNKGFPLTDLVWNDDRLNLSVRCRVTGTIQLGKGHKKVGFEEKYPTYVWRTYTIIRDGALNVTKLPVMSGDKHYVIELDKYPLVNKAIVSSLPSATDLAADAWDNLQLSASLKVIKHFIDKKTENDEEEKLSEFLTPEQDEFLKRHSITKSGFSPSGIEEKATDHYMATQFSINIDGYSNLPSINAVTKKQASGKKLTRSEELIAFNIDEYEQDSVAELTADLKNQLAKQRAIRYNIQKAKFAVVLGHLWFPEFASRENCLLEIDGQKFEFVIKPLKVEI